MKYIITEEQRMKILGILHNLPVGFDGGVLYNFFSTLVPVQEDAPKEQQDKNEAGNKSA